MSLSVDMFSIETGKSMVLGQQDYFIFIVTHLNPSFTSSSNHVYSLLIFSRAQTFVFLRAYFFVLP